MQATAHPMRTVLRKHDGIDTLYLEQRSGEVMLGWLLVGQAEPFGLLLEAAIDWSDATRLADDPTTDPVAILAGHAGETAEMILFTAGGNTAMRGPLPAHVDAGWALDITLTVMRAGSNPSTTPWAGDGPPLATIDVASVEKVAASV